jgi:hypothetical protein
MHALVFRIRVLGNVKDLTECYSLYNFSPHSPDCQAIMAHNEYVRRCAHYASTGNLNKTFISHETTHRPKKTEKNLKTFLVIVTRFFMMCINKSIFPRVSHPKLMYRFLLKLVSALGI